MIVSFAVLNTRKEEQQQPQEDQQVFVLNGIQTQSGYCYNLVNDLPSMQGFG